MIVLDKQPLVSIILPCFNGEKFLGEAIESCLNQTLTNLELIIVDDGSTDNSLEIAKSFASSDSRIVIIENETNKKLPKSLNIGHNAAKGDFLTWTSHDNLLQPDCLEELLNGLINFGSDITFSDYLVIYEDGTIKRRHSSGPVESLLFGNSIGPSFLYKKEVFHALKGYNPNLFLVEDFDFWLRASLNFKFIHVSKVLYSYRLQARSLTYEIHNNPAREKEHENGRYQIIKATAEYLNWSYETKELITCFLLNKNFSLSLYFDNKGVIGRDLKKYCGKFLDLNKTIAALSSILRSQLQSNDSEKNISTLIQIILKNRKILFQPHYSNKETFRLIYKCLISR
ncbi:glycosyltransferase [Salinimicrobium sp. 3283s]|uniref:glycosyltransferase family 2 protein n=1 Tax=Salinimicrobium sp. 3283s TaxID=3114359 RepID=UPI0031E935E5